MMKRAIVFDLSEVLIAGLLGVEKVLAPRLGLEPESVLAVLGSEVLNDLCRGHITEDEYLSRILAREKWTISADEIKPMLRDNFHHRVAGMDEILNRLSLQHELFLLSDHGREWAEYIRSTHAFLNIFKAQFFSFELGQMKHDPSTFTKALKMIEREPEDCLLIDDSRRNIASAASVGVEGIRFENAAQLSARLIEKEIF